eukprot:m.63747 g.63747  ORF g.63747 m.63747 type:complete len:82 (+) comp8177_c0_seq2:462-707(+)
MCHPHPSISLWLPPISPALSTFQVRVLIPRIVTVGVVYTFASRVDHLDASVCMRVCRGTSNVVIIVTTSPVLARARCYPVG